MRRVRWALVSAGFMIAAGSVSAISADETETPREPPPEFTKAYLDDPKNLEAGLAIWEEQCRHCHGASAYPGKAPKLKPYSYKPDFVFDRVTYGFEKMPPWIDAYSREERMAVVAYILSEDFSP